MLVAAALVAGCPNDPAPPTDACSEGGGSLRVGTATSGSVSAFRELANGDGVYIVPGPQGGQHIWVGLRARGVNPTQARVALRAYRASDGVQIGSLIVRLRLVVAPEDPSAWALPSLTLILDDDQYCSILPGDVRVAVDFDDQHGRCFHVERLVRVTDVDPSALAIDREARFRCCRERLRRCFPDAGPAPFDAPLDAPLDASLD